MYNISFLPFKSDEEQTYDLGLDQIWIYSRLILKCMFNLAVQKTSGFVSETPFWSDCKTFTIKEDGA